MGALKKCGISLISIHAPQYEVRHKSFLSIITSLSISIHAPQYEVRRRHFLFLFDVKKISIHAPQYEVRHEYFHFCSRMLKFQSTHPNTRCDRKLTSSIACVGDFNPRTPIRGATSHAHLLKSIRNYFNPRTPIRGATDIV